MNPMIPFIQTQSPVLMLCKGNIAGRGTLSHVACWSTLQIKTSTTSAYAWGPSSAWSGPPANIPRWRLPSESALSSTYPILALVLAWLQELISVRFKKPCWTSTRVSRSTWNAAQQVRQHRSVYDPQDSSESTCFPGQTTILEESLTYKLNSLQSWRRCDRSGQ